MAEDKKTQLGTTSRSARPSAAPPVGGTASPLAATAPPLAASPPSHAATAPAPPATGVKQTSYLPEVPDPLLGATVVGRYLIERKLGEGGMGAVYLATHKLLEKHVALKVLHGEFARKPDLVERFMQEAKAASRIRHENVIDISDFGSTPEGLVFFAMELLNGHDLHQEIGQARVEGHLLPWSRTKKIYLQICSALAAAHAKGVIHRDLKPENVYLVEFLDDPDFVKLLDFGIAKLTEVNEEGARKLTRTGMLFGTPEYMSPEQARGEAVDHRVDVYAMGCILFQLITGHVPFVADSFMGVLSLHLTEEPPVIPPEVFDHIGAPRGLAGVIDRALAKDRNVRFQTMDELAAELRRVCGDRAPTDKPVRQRPPSIPAPITGVMRRREPTLQTKKTEWTGKISVPEVEAEIAAPIGSPRHASAPWLAIGAVVVLVGGGIAIYALTRDSGVSARGAGNTPAAAATDPALGSGAPAAPPSAQPVATPSTPPAPAPSSNAPAQATLALDSTPHGATVTDLSTGRAIGKTPVPYSVPGSATPRRLLFHLAGYTDAIVDVVPDHTTAAYAPTLVRGAWGAAPQIHTMPAGTEPGTPSTGAVTVPDTSGAVTRPDPLAPQPTKPEVAKPAATPDTKPSKAAEPSKADDCGDGSEPCLKRNIPGLGSGSGS